jgi:hypothetical protein
MVMVATADVWLVAAAVTVSDVQLLLVCDVQVKLPDCDEPFAIVTDVTESEPPDFVRLTVMVEPVFVLTLPYGSVRLTEETILLLRPTTAVQAKSLAMQSVDVALTVVLVKARRVAEPAVTVRVVDPVTLPLVAVRVMALPTIFGVTLNVATPLLNAELTAVVAALPLGLAASAAPDHAIVPAKAVSVLLSARCAVTVTVAAVPAATLAGLADSANFVAPAGSGVPDTGSAALFQRWSVWVPR